MESDPPGVNGKHAVRSLKDIVGTVRFCRGEITAKENHSGGSTHHRRGR